MNATGDFIIRVYGLIINTKNEVLITDEFQLGMEMTKFPGGGLQFGEGTVDCLRREFREECNGQEIKNLRHYYTTEHFQKALFYENAQLISIYYQAELIHPIRFAITDKPFGFEKKENGCQSFRWLNLSTATADMLTFPIDQMVLAKLIHKK